MTQFKPSLESHHIELLAKRGISEEFALQSHVRTLMDNEARSLGFISSIPADQRKKGLQGVGFEYVNPLNGQATTWRLRPDTKFTLNAKEAKYLSRKGDPVRVFYPHTTTSEQLENSKVPLVITEAELKAVSIAENLAKINKTFAVIGLAGVNGGWGRQKDMVFCPDGTHQKKSRGPARLIPDLADIEWKKRPVFLVFDSDVGTAKHASLFKRSKYQGAMGAEHILAELLRARGADVRIVVIPDPGDGSKFGADDYIAQNGSYEFYKLLVNNWVAKRNPDEILRKPQPETFKFEDARELIATKLDRPVFIIDRLVPIGGTAIIAAAPKLGKSGIALNAAKSVCEGSEFLGLFPTTKGKTAYIQTEIPKWAMAERLKLMGELPEGMLIYTPNRLHLNFFEDQGYKRTETGNREKAGALVEALKSHAISLAIFDPLTHFHTLNENNPEHMTHLFEVFRAIARAVPCGVLIVHHHRKTARSQVSYEGMEDMRASMVLGAEPDSVLSLYAKERSDGTRKFKLKFEIRHGEQPGALELLRYGGENAMLWKAVPWDDSMAATRSLQDHRDILFALDKGPMTASKIVAATDKPKTTIYRRLNELEEAGEVAKNGNLYYVAGGNYDPA
ncbi:AAA family ATPase [Acidobacteria bacterium AH-259-D05]|nr:AAA family ATPase [Acidobacteria bacterium AH-259-D05]